MIVLPAAAFTWLGMVLAISFLEAPLKFRAPGITVRWVVPSPGPPRTTWLPTAARAQALAGP